MAKCLKSSGNGSCPLDAVEGSLFCQKHSNEISLQRNYLLEDAKLAGSMERQQGSNMLYSLREEVMLLRAMVQDRLNMAKSDAERMMAYQQIGSWIGTIEKLVVSLNKLEKETSEVLTRATLIQVGQQLVSIIAEEISHLPNHEMVIDAIANRVVPVIEEAANVKEK